MHGVTVGSAVLSPGALTDPGCTGVVRVLGGPGTGKSTLLVETAAAHIEAGADPESVLLLTGSSRLGAQARAAVTARLLRSAPDRSVIREPIVRTVHSYAFAVLRQAAQRTGAPPPRLITSAEQDAIIRELLAGDLADGDRSPVRWPEHLRPALTTAGFATELRDLIARCTERGVDPVELQRIGRRAGRPEWVAAGRFAQVYEQVMLLRAAVGAAAPQATMPALGAAELVGAVLEAFAVDADLLAAERARVRLLLVDDAQQLDPQAAELVRVLAAGARLAVLAGDPGQAVFGYRGADPALLRGDSPVVRLTESHRCAPAVARAITGIARRLPGADDAPRALGSAVSEPGTVTLRLAASPHAESALIADALRRAHLVDGLAWSQMAVIVRSVPRTGVPLARALLAAGVPVELPAAGSPPAEHPAVAALLTVLATVVDGLDGDKALALLTGPIGRVDPVTLRQLRRALRRADPTGGTGRTFGDLLVWALEAETVPVGAELARPLRRVRAVLEAARRSHADGHELRYTLWQAWDRTGLQRRWVAAAERGGPAGAQADRDLDAVTTLFDIAEQYVTRTAGATLRGLIDHVRSLGPAVVARTEHDSDTVAVLSAHAALGREWEFVVIAGLQDGLWPNTTPRGGVLGTGRLVDLIDGVTDAAGPAGVSARAPLLAEERRLLIAAMGRARTRLLVTAVDSDTDESLMPSPFCTELAELVSDPHPAGQSPLPAPRVLAPAALVGRLRAVVCAPDGAVEESLRVLAATQLARLARAGVPGADPAEWHALTPLSTEEPLSGDDEPVTLSPSTLQTLVDCPLRWLVERHGGTDGRDVGSAVGSLVHALVAESGRSADEMTAELEKVWDDLPYEARWYARNELARHREMLVAFERWRTATRGRLTEVATEVDAEGPIADGVRLRGRLDRVERDTEGRLVVVDLKTGKNPVTKDKAREHAQLAAYQLAVLAGLLGEGETPGGGRLVYLGKPNRSGPAEREQDPLTEESAEQWRRTVREAAAATRGPCFPARVNDSCRHCPARGFCPARVADAGEES